MNINEELSQLEIQRQITEKTKSDLKEKMLKLRKKTQNSITSYNTRIALKNEELDKINEFICLNFGHEFTPFEEKEDKHVDRMYYYERECGICGKIEIERNQPANYITKDSTSKVYVYGKNNPKY